MNELFLKRTGRAWNMSSEGTSQLLATKYATSIRLNPLKVRKSTFVTLKKHYPLINKIIWCDNAYTITNPSIPPSQLPGFTSGEFIIQNPASFIPVLELQPRPNQSILDMCAAPGVKSSHIAALANNKARLILNDTSRTRFFKMKKMTQNMGVTAEYSLKDGRYLSKAYPVNFFDKILLDAPCSGEANLNTQTIKTWSLASIKRLSTLQARLLQESYNMLKPGGRLVYSTCTIAPEENELVVDSLLRHNQSAQLLQPKVYPVRALPGLTVWGGKSLSSEIYKCIRLLPSEIVKPFFIAVITKTTNTSTDADDSYQRLIQHYR